MAVDDIDILHTNDITTNLAVDDFLEQPLSIPQDSLEDLDLFKNFSGDFISVTSLDSHLSVPKPTNGNEFTLEKKPLTQDFLLGAAVATKKRRSKRVANKKLHAWSSKERTFSLLSNVDVSGHMMRKCRHCQTASTPQWRMGPMGPKTLCNACVMMAVTSACKDNKMAMNNGKYVRYMLEQVEALERLYHECPKPSSLHRQQLIPTFATTNTSCESVVTSGQRQVTPQCPPQDASPARLLSIA
ncbi:hypothetical protein F0562_006183 [Nyssa sinensis]|uniref:GATA-type domain-containing protein n=1 Tax=Nyssa sinensis TaxID=561372 RepID=A0A5J5AME6_9ASTE|nr:hypothetical protein F0562_006183 [Nyssa sinensis]